MGFVIIPDDDPRYFYKEYRIFRNEVNRNLWGVKSPSGSVIIEPIFNEISWIRGIEWANIPALIVFELNDMKAVCTFEQMLEQYNKKQ